ncbi:hypothetical protein [uncultured Rothia sp.]|uniref:hypothetical protein n=1 Tax=uncultured Rothia sp. TaxID=316088 RepID=UPI0032173D13
MITFMKDIEKATRAQLLKTFPNIPISSREPAPRPDQWIKYFIGQGSTTHNPVHESITLTIEVWNQNNEEQANQLAQKIRLEISRWGWERGFYLDDGKTRARVISTSTPRPVSYPPGERWSRYTGTYQIVLSRASKS